MAGKVSDVLMAEAIADVPTRPTAHPTSGDRIFRFAATAAASVSLVIVVGTLVFLVKEARPAFHKNGIVHFFTSSQWAPGQGKFGVEGLLVGTLIIATISMVIAVPLGVGMAMFINEYAPARLKKPLTSVVDLLAALPSLLFGMWGVASTSITQPTQNPFHAPGDALGNPVAFTVSATGFLPQDTQVYVEVCDGVSPSSAGYSVTDHCDLGTSPAPVSSDANGNVTWDANSLQAGKRFKPFKGESPQSQFNCLSPNDPPMTPVNGLTDYTNCQLRVSTNNSTATPDQVYLPFVLPDAKPHCDVNGTVKISPGVTSTASVKAVKLTYKGTFTNCVGFDGFTGAKLPISGGTFSATIGGLNLGSTCSNIFTGFGAKPSAKLSFKMTGLKAGKPAAATGSTAAVISTVTEQANPFGHTATATTIDNVKSLFNGLTPKLTLKYDETQAQRDALCAASKGMGLLHFGNVTDKTLGAFTPVNGASIFELD